MAIEEVCYILAWYGGFVINNLCRNLALRSQTNMRIPSIVVRYPLYYEAFATNWLGIVDKAVDYILEQPDGESGKSGAKTVLTFSFSALRSWLRWRCTGRSSLFMETWHSGEWSLVYLRFCNIVEANSKHPTRPAHAQRDKFVL
jgi:hypothetical protein